MDQSSLIVETCAAVAVRAAFASGCYRFVSGLLSSDIRLVIDHEPDSSGQGSPVTTPTKGRPFQWLAFSTRGPLLANRTPAPRAERASYPRLARFVFCASFAESCMLFALVIFGEFLSSRSRTYNWNISLGSLLALIVLIVPFGQCLLVTYRNKSSSTALSGRILFLTLLLFGSYLFCFLQIGDYLSTILGVNEGTNTLSLFTNILERICVPGVALIAGLSGFGAVNTAWEAFEWRSLSKKEVVTDAIILSAERALGRARADLEDRRADLNAAENAPVDHSGRSFLGRMFSGDASSASMPIRRANSPRPHAQAAVRPAELSALRQEVAGLVAMEAQMVRDLHTLRSRKAVLDMSKTWKGKIWSAVGIGFALYCAVRIVLVCRSLPKSLGATPNEAIQSVVNLIFGYSEAQVERGGPEEDLASQFLRHAIRLTGLHIDAAHWSPVINLALIGLIISANLRAVLAQVSQILHATSAAISASFLLLCLAQLMAIYLVTSLVALPAQPGSSTAQLLDTLPNFRTYSRLFDGVFLFVALGSLAVKWLGKQVRADDVAIGSLGLETFGRGDDGRSHV